MKTLIPLFGSGMLAIILGASNRFALLGVNSPQMLILAGALLLVIGYGCLMRLEVEPTATLTHKKRLWWRVALVVVCSFLALLGLFLIIGFSVATLARGEAVRTEMATATVMGCVMCIPLIPSMYSLKKAQSDNKAFGNSPVFKASSQ